MNEAADRPEEAPGHSARAAALGARWIAAYNSRDAAGVVATCGDDVIYEDPALESGQIQGRAAMQAELERFFQAFPDWTVRWLERHVAPDGDVEVGLWECSGTFMAPLDPPGIPATGGAVRMKGITRTEINGGRYCRIQNFYDTAALARQLEVTPGTLIPAG